MGCHDFKVSKQGPKTDFLNRLKDFKSVDGETAMHRMMQGYSDDELALIADYFGTEQ